MLQCDAAMRCCEEAAMKPQPVWSEKTFHLSATVTLFLALRLPFLEKMKNSQNHKAIDVITFFIHSSMDDLHNIIILMCDNIPTLGHHKEGKRRVIGLDMLFTVYEVMTNAHYTHMHWSTEKFCGQKTAQEEEVL